MTVPEMYRLEPTLQALAAYAAAEGTRKAYTDRCRAYEIVKDLADTLIGWNAHNQALRTSAAWKSYFSHITHLLRL